MDIVSVALERYSTRAFDPNEKLAVEQAEKLKTLLQFSPSSANSWPWHFTVADTDEGKVRVAKSAAGGFVLNGRKMPDASHIMVFCTKTAMDNAWLECVVDQEENDSRFATSETKAINHRGRTFFTDMHRKGLKDGNHWMTRQVCLNVGNFLLGVAAMDLDAVPIEGLDSTVMDAEFGLKEKGFTNVVVVPMGHRSVEDFNAALPKSHLPLGTTLAEV